jgi:hypothetical protein
MNYGLRDYLYDLEYGPDEDGCPDCGCFECECEFGEDGALTECRPDPLRGVAP